MKTFKAKDWNGKIDGECTTAAFRRAYTNPDPDKFIEIDDEMKSSRGTPANLLWIQNGVEVWGWL